MVFTVSNTRIEEKFLTNNQIMAAFPFLKRLQQLVPPGGCMPCKRKKIQAAYNKEAERAKHLLATMPQEKVVLLKQLLGLAPGDVIRIYYLEGNVTRDKSL